MPDEPLLDDQPLRLSMLERRALRSVRRHGIARFVVIQSLAAVALSVLLVVVSWWILDRFHELGSWGYALALAAIVPAIVAPPLIAFGARLIARLEATRQLLRVSSVTDPLTGVANRRGFFEELDRFDVIAADPAMTAASVVGMVDIDAFKTLNDTHGHAFGDRALIVVADWLMSVAEADGLVGRLGGDEFAFVTTVDRVGSLTDRHCFSLEGVAFSASVGIVAHDRGRVVEDLQAADVALYRVKRARAVSEMC